MIGSNILYHKNVRFKFKKEMTINEFFSFIKNLGFTYFEWGNKIYRIYPDRNNGDWKFSETPFILFDNKILNPTLKQTEDAIIDLSYIGQKVSKYNKTSFKSGLLSNTVLNFTINPESQNIAFTFMEDDSIVDVYQCHTALK